VIDTVVCGPRELECIVQQVSERGGDDLSVRIDDDPELHRIHD
jgi:hypothetical protein